MIKKFYILTIYNEPIRPVIDHISKNRDTAINFLKVHYNTYNTKYTLEDQEIK